MNTRDCVIKALAAQAPVLGKIFSLDLERSRSKDDETTSAFRGQISKIELDSTGENADKHLSLAEFESQKHCLSHLIYSKESLVSKIEDIYRGLDLAARRTVGRMAMEESKNNGRAVALASGLGDLFGKWELHTDQDLFWWTAKFEITWLRPKK